MKNTSSEACRSNALVSSGLRAYIGAQWIQIISSFPQVVGQSEMSEIIQNGIQSGVSSSVEDGMSFISFQKYYLEEKVKMR